MLAIGESRLTQAALLDTEEALQKTLQVRDEAKAHIRPLCIAPFCAHSACGWEYLLFGRYRANKNMLEPRGTFSPENFMVCTMHVAFK